MDEPLVDLERLRQLVLSMPMARTLHLEFLRLDRGASELRIPVDDAFSFRPGQLQATPVFAVADFAAVSAAGSVLPAGWGNATVDGSIKLVAPAAGAFLVARGRVIDAGRVLTVCASDVFAVDAAGSERLCATFLGTARNIAPTRS